MITPKNWKVSAVAILIFALLMATVCLATPGTKASHENVSDNSVVSDEPSHEVSEEVSDPESSIPAPDESSSVEDPSAAPDESNPEDLDPSTPDGDTVPFPPPVKDPVRFPQDIPEDAPIPEPEPEPEPELPDTLTVEVKFYNWESTGFNKVDGAKYCADIAKMMQKYAPEGLHISAGVAMAYTEGGAGKAGVYTRTNNCFGIRAYSNWDGYVYSRTTGKVYKDWETAYRYGDVDDTFRAYDCMEDSVKDYCELISGDHYNHCFTMESNEAYLRYILSQGYGEAHLADTWLYLIRLYDLEQYDIKKPIVDVCPDTSTDFVPVTP